MEPRTLVLIDEDGGRRDRMARCLRAFEFDVRVLSPAAAEIDFPLADPEGGLILIALGRSDIRSFRFAQGLKKARPALRIIALVPAPEADFASKLIREGWVDGAAAQEIPAGVVSLVRSELGRARSETRSEIFAQMLRRLKAQQSRHARRAHELEEVYDTTLENLMTALDIRDGETFGHSQTVAKYTQVLARIVGLDDDSALENMYKGALLHDIGKIAIPDSILKKPGPLSSREWEKIRLHPSLGHGLIKEIKLVPAVGSIILCHHERYDGTGYPQGLRGNAIPLEARLFAVADALDAITAHRPYRRARDFRYAQREIVRQAGTQFDPEVVEAFISLKPEKWEKIRFETTCRFPGIQEFSELAKKIKG